MIYDCFPFFNELDILELRLNILYDHVDKFVVVEGDKTHRGVQKDFIFEQNKSRFEKFLDKIIYIKVEDFPSLEDSKESEDGNKWLYENYQRDAIMRGLSNCKDDDIVIISDCDEIPNPKAIKKYKNGLCALLQMRFAYFYNVLCKESSFSKAPKICRYKDLIDPKQEIISKHLAYCKYSKYGLPTYLRFCIGKRIYNGGWHFSFIGDEKFILNKVSAVVEKQYIESINKSDIPPEDIVNRNIQAFKNSQFCLKISNVFPKYFLENIEKYEKFICKEKQIPYWRAFLLIYWIKILKALRLY